MCGPHVGLRQRSPSVGTTAAMRAGCEQSLAKQAGSRGLYGFYGVCEKAEAWSYSADEIPCESVISQLQP